MLSNEQVLQTLLSAYNKIAEVSTDNNNNLIAGFPVSDLQLDNKIYCYAQAVRRQYILGDLTSVKFLKVYDYLGKLVGIPKYNDIMNAINPYYQGPYLSIDITNNNTGAIVNSTIIPFTGQTTISLLSYQSAYYATYGNTPYVQIFVADGTGKYNADMSTSPKYTYVISGNPSSGIVSIVWTYPVATNGYILISGVQPS